MEKGDSVTDGVEHIVMCIFVIERYERILYTQVQLHDIQQCTLYCIREIFTVQIQVTHTVLYKHFRHLLHLIIIIIICDFMKGQKHLDTWDSLKKKNFFQHFEKYKIYCLNILCCNYIM